MPRSDRPGPPGLPDLEDVLQDLLSGGIRDEHELKRLIQRRVDEYNATPQPDLGGLSPDQMYRLVHFGWSTGGPIVLARDLTPGDLASSDMLADARTLLAFVADAGDVKLTQARYIPPALLATLLPSLRLEQEGLATPWGIKREADARWLLPLRDMLVLARCLDVRGRTMRVTDEGRRMMRTESSGELFRLMFEAFFGAVVVDEVPEIHELGLGPSIPFALYRMPRVASRWASGRAIASQCIPGGAELDHELLPGPITRALLWPLVAFGLLEEQERHPLKLTDRFRVTPLYSKFVRFEFPRTSSRFM